MTEQSAIALAFIQQNVRRIVRRFNDPSDGKLYYPETIEDEINDTIVRLLEIRPEAIEIDRVGG